MAAWANSFGVTSWKSIGRPVTSAMVATCWRAVRACGPVRRYPLPAWLSSVAAAARPRSLLRAVRYTRCPASPRRGAVSRPMPLSAPVTNATGAPADSVLTFGSVLSITLRPRVPQPGSSWETSSLRVARPTTDPSVRPRIVMTRCPGEARWPGEVVPVVQVGDQAGVDWPPAQPLAGQRAGGGVVRSRERGEEAEVAGG